MVVVEEENNMVILSFDETCVTIKEEQTSNIMNRIQITLAINNFKTNPMKYKIPSTLITEVKPF